MPHTNTVCLFISRLIPDGFNTVSKGTQNKVRGKRESKEDIKQRRERGCAGA